MNTSSFQPSVRFALGFAVASTLAVLGMAYSPGTLRAQRCEEGDAPQECTRPPIPCSATADCPEALSCLTTRVVESCPVASGGEPIAGDAGCTIAEEPIEDPSCVYVVVKCSDDSQCEPGLSCQALGSVSDCNSSSAGTTCTERTTSFCFPIRRDCETTSDCEGTWRCAALPEDAWQNPPPGWEGATSICAPEGIALYIEGRVEVESESSSEPDSAARGNVEASGADDDSRAASDASGGCTVSASSRESRQLPFGASCFMLLSSALLLSRRRART